MGTLKPIWHCIALTDLSCSHLSETIPNKEQKTVKRPFSSVAGTDGRLFLRLRATEGSETGEEESIKKERESGKEAEMVFNSLLVVTVANLSADLCQYIACNPQRLSSRHVLHLICCLPLQQLGRLALCLCSFFCFPPPDSYYYPSSSDSSSDDDSDYDSDDSHSD